jgi:L-ascorbate metabolism protein UlaG (beta-lactamase superfamily)
VLGIARHLAAYAAWAVDRGDRERDDASALGQLRAVDLGLPAGLEVDWLGTAGYRLRCEGRTLFIDPYVTRVALGDVVRGRRALPDPALHARHLDPGGEVVGVLVGHTHFDHAVDVPLLARAHGARAYGSSSLARLMRLHGAGDLAVEVEPHRPYELGPFTVTFVPSRHSKLVLGLAVPFDGELTCEHLDGLSPSAYRCGPVYGIHVQVAGATLYHQGSADLLDDEIRHRDVDVFLAGIAGRRFTERYWSRILGRLQPRVVVASHFDDFMRPLDAPLRFSANVNLAGWPDEIAAVSRDIAVAALPPPV